MSVVDGAREDLESADVLQLLGASQLQIGAVDEGKSARLKVDIDDGLFEVLEAQETACAEGHLNEFISVELG